MRIKRFYQLLLMFALFLAFLIAEFFFCGVYFRFVRPSDYLKADWIGGLSAPFLCYAVFRKAIQAALREKVPHLLVAGSFLFFTILGGLFLRFSLQWANGGLDFSGPENHVVIVTGKEISAFGGSIREGINPMAHMVYFRNWDPDGEKCEMLTPQDFYYAVDTGSLVQISLRQGLFHWPWVEDYQLLNTRLMPSGN